jgi:hypothetical protein
MKRDLRPGRARDRDSSIGVLQAQRVLSVVAVVLVAVVTLLPSRTEHRMSILTEGRQIGGELGSVLPLLIIGMVGLAVVGVVWKSRLATRLRLSWPLFIVGGAYLLGLVVLVSSSVRRAIFGLVSTGQVAWLGRITDQLDAEHTVTYAAVMILVALAWRPKIALWWLGLGLFAYGYVLEVLQRFVPGREYRLDDLAANGLGIVIGLVGVLLWDLLVDFKQNSAFPVHTERRERRASRSLRSSSRSSRESKRVGLITTLVGLLIAIASILAGSVVELRFAQVGWQLFTEFSAGYALTFWLGLLVMIVGGLMLRGHPGQRSGARSR